MGENEITEIAEMVFSVGEEEVKERKLGEFLRDEEEEEEEEMEIEVRRTSRSRSWRNLKEILASRSIGCCGATWRFKSIPAIASRAEETEQGEGQVEEGDVEEESESSSAAAAAAEEGRSPMNLAAALAEERRLRAARGDGFVVGPTGAAERVSLMRLLVEETAEGGGDGGGGEGNDQVCCVCMVRSKGAAFIPCGHTFCRVCSREVWLNRGACALCNRPINEILDLY
ncbi:hypothetical protein Scep_028844 [Stephania cephalantha]|uniref:RING-type domain-containing protein n=1 Tax=Stephania cephalantha TaxID=152367 RepID=A0AAP0EFA4_9MAGN